MGGQRALRPVAGLLVAEGVLGVAYGLWLVAELPWSADIGPLLEVSSPAWAGAVAAQVATTVVVPSLAVAWLGWRWWKSPRRFTTTRRIVLYGVLAANVITAALAFLAHARIVVAIASMGVAASLAALVMGLRSTGAPPDDVEVQTIRPIRWGRAVLLGAVLVLLASAASATVASVHHSTDGDIFDGVYPDDVVACRGPMDASCAAEAAHRSALTVAWLPDAPGRKSRAFVVARRPNTPMPLRAGSVFQDGRVGWVRFDLNTNPGPPAVGRAAGTIQVGDTAASMRVDDSDNASFVYLDWTRDGVAYRLTAFRLTEATKAVIAEAKRLLGDVKYTSPPARSASSRRHRGLLMV